MRQSQLLPPAVESFRGVEKEILFCYLGWYLEEVLQLVEASPGLLDELVPVHNVYLL